MFPILIGGVIVWLVWGWVKEQSSDDGGGAAPPPSSQSIVPAGSPSGPALPLHSMKVWLELVNQRRDQYPHLFLVGKTRSGKTETVKAIVNDRLGKQGGAVVIIDPKARPNKWGVGVSGVGLDENAEYSLIEAALGWVLSELKQRQHQMQEGTTDFPPLTVVVDELITIAYETKLAPDVFKKVGVIGAELNIRLIAISQSERVKPLGLDGSGDLRDNYLYIGLGNKARDLYPYTTARYPAVAKLDGGLAELDTTKVPNISGKGVDSKLVISDFPTTTTTALEGQEPDVVVVDEERILEAARAMVERDGKVVRTRLCKELYGTAGGQSYAKMREVLDRNGL